MAKPRIIIADTDENYILSLQLKFIEEFFEKIDLEIITDSEYFDSLFKTPQKVDILIVSEEMYVFSLQKHNIGNIFIMMEQYEKEQTAELNVNRLFKYTSIKEIFNEIVGKSAEALEIDRDIKKETRIIVVTSACGGVGKTTVAMGISACLTKNYKKVLYIDAERMQSFQSMLENPSVISATEVYQKLSENNTDIYQEIRHVIRSETFYYLPPFKAALMSLGLPYSIYEMIVISAKKSKDYDYIVVDTDTVFDEYKANLLNIADKVIIVTEQTKAAVYATNLLVSNINGISPDKYFFVCNNFDKKNDNALISPNVSMRFTVNDYIDHFRHFAQSRCEEVSKDSGIQKTAFLII